MLASSDTCVAVNAKEAKGAWFTFQQGLKAPAERVNPRPGAAVLANLLQRR